MKSNETILCFSEGKRILYEFTERVKSKASLCVESTILDVKIAVNENHGVV